MIEMMKGKTIEEAKKIKDKDIAKILELPPIKIHCSVLAEDSIYQAIADYESKKAKTKHIKFHFKSLSSFQAYGLKTRQGK